MSHDDAQDGVLSAEMIASLMNDGVIAGADASKLQPASLDLTLGARAWRVRASFLPSRARTVAARLEEMTKQVGLALVVLASSQCWSRAAPRCSGCLRGPKCRKAWAI